MLSRTGVHNGRSCDIMPGMDEQNQAGHFVPIREYLTLSIEPLRQEVKMLRQAIEQLSTGMISQAEWERMDGKCKEYGVRLDALDERLDTLEHYHSVGMWAFRTLAGIATAVTIALAIKWLVG